MTCELGEGRGFWTGPVHLCLLKGPKLLVADMDIQKVLCGPISKR